MSWALTHHRLRDVLRRLGRAVPAPARNVAGLARGTAVAQMAMLLAIPVLARLYGLEAFGVFGVFSTASTALAVAAAGRFEQAIIPAPGDRDALCLVHISLATVASACVVLAIGLLAARPAFAALVSSPGMRAALYWIPLGVAVQAVGQVLLQWATRLHRDAAIARFFAERAMIMSGVQIVLGVIGTGQNGLVLGQIAGFAGAALLLRGRLAGRVTADAASIGIREIIQVARTNIDFPRYGLPRTLIEAIAAIAQPIMVATLFGAAAMGGYWMAQRILGLPGAVVGDPVRQIFFRKASEARRSGAPLFPMTIRTILALSMITLPFAAVMVIASEAIFAVILGPSWALAAVS